MSCGDFTDFEAGDTLAMLKHESVINEPVGFGEKHDGDFLNSLHTPEEERKLIESSVKVTRNEEIRTPIKNTENESRIGHRRVHTDGGISYKRIKTSKIMDSIQLGIQRSVGAMSADPDRDVLMMDFMTVESTSFTVQDPLLSSAKHSEFIFKTFAPIAFRHFRELFGIKPDDFVTAFCSEALMELPNPGASGSVFYLTQNDDFITKTVQRREAEFLQKLLPGYYLNINQNPCTLLPKFFGLYCYECDSKHVRMVVMNNVLPSAIKIHQKYDLKGSTYNRKASTAECQKTLPTYKDLDFLSHYPDGIFLDSNTYKKVMKTIQRDCRVLESFQIIDYSLLIGVHKLDQTKKEQVQSDQSQPSSKDENNMPFGDGNVRDKAQEDSETSNVQDGKAEKTGGKFDKHCALSGLQARKASGEKLLLFIGIIDILQSYRLKKRLEHIWKSVFHDGDSVSVHNPKFYAQRFQDFMFKTVFKTTPSKSVKRKSGSRQKPTEELVGD